MRNINKIIDVDEVIRCLQNEDIDELYTFDPDLVLTVDDISTDLLESLTEDGPITLTIWEQTKYAEISAELIVSERDLPYGEKLIQIGEEDLTAEAYTRLSQLLSKGYLWVLVTPCEDDIWEE
jgi:hypothetical protein